MVAKAGVAGLRWGDFCRAPCSRGTVATGGQSPGKESEAWIAASAVTPEKFALLSYVRYLRNSELAPDNIDSRFVR